MCTCLKCWREDGNSGRLRPTEVSEICSERGGSKWLMSLAATDSGFSTAWSSDGRKFATASQGRLIVNSFKELS